MQLRRGPIDQQEGVEQIAERKPLGLASLQQLLGAKPCVCQELLWDQVSGEESMPELDTFTCCG
eukprot:2541398-Amphidinium_carterae.1